MIGIISLLAVLILPAYSFCQDNPSKDVELKKGCLGAAISGIKLEIKRNEGWLRYAENEAKKEVINQKIKQLEAELIKYAAMNLADYQLPEKKEMEAWFEVPVKDDAILKFAEISRSGPWYHVTGIRGADYSIIKPKKKYFMTFYLVYPREYGWMASSYIYLDQIK
jgi:hypothetical protein